MSIVLHHGVSPPLLPLFCLFFFRPCGCLTAYLLVALRSVFFLFAFLSVMNTTGGYDLPVLLHSVRVSIQVSSTCRPCAPNLSMIAVAIHDENKCGHEQEMAGAGSVTSGREIVQKQEQITRDGNCHEEDYGLSYLRITLFGHKLSSTSFTGARHKKHHRYKTKKVKKRGANIWENGRRGTERRNTMHIAEI